MPVDPEVEDLIELLDESVKDMDLEKSEYELLKQAIGKGKFKAVCSIVQLKLRERGKY